MNCPSSPEAPDSASNSNAIFEMAYAEFVASLPADEQALVKNCCSADELSQQFKSIPEFERLNNSRRKKVLGHINAFSDALRPFTAVIDLFVSSHPEWAAVLWGSVKLLFQLSSSFTVFFHRLSEILDQISLKFPKYGTLLEFMTRSGLKATPTMQAVIRHNYRIILSFFQSLARIFLKKTGSPRSRIATATKLMVSPFNVQLDQLLSDLEIHDQAIRDELQIWQLQQAQSHLQSSTLTHRHLAQQSQRAAMDKCEIIKEIQQRCDESNRRFTETYADTLRIQVRSWLDPPEFMEIYEVARSRVHGSSGNWFFQEKKVREWELGTASPANKCWVHGLPGAGKTTLAASFIDHLKDGHFSAPRRRTVLFYFFRAGDSKVNNVIAACRAILAQILQQHWKSQEVMDRFSFAMTESSGQTTASREEVFGLVRLCFSTISDCFLVLDGVDECFDANPGTSHDFGSLFTLDVAANIMYFSRPSGPGISQLAQNIPPGQSLRIGNSNSGDIQNFCHEKLLRLIELDLLPTLDNVDGTVERLVLGSSGMFLWAGLVFQVLESPLFVDQWDRLEMLESIKNPEGLDQMFYRILERIKSQGSAAVRIVVNILAWILFDSRSKSGISPPELRAGLYPEKKTPLAPIADFVQMTTMICCSLVDLDGCGQLSFVHHSVCEFLRGVVEAADRAEQLPLPILSTASSHALIASAGLKYLLAKFPVASWTPGVKRSSLISEFPLAAYATAGWTTHAVAILTHIYRDHSNNANPISEQVATLLGLVQQMLSSPGSVTVWMELCFIFDIPMDVTPGFYSTYLTLQYLIDLMQIPRERRFTEHQRSMVKILEPLIEILEYMRSLRATWGEKLVQCPNIVWREAQIFGKPPSHFALKELEVETVRMQDLTPDLSTSQHASTQSLRSVSALSPDNQRLAVVTIWPSRYFCEVAKLSEIRPKSVNAGKLCSGWIAVYEEWTVVEPITRQLSVCTPIDSEEIAFQIRQSGCGGFSLLRRSWSIQFPVTIASEQRVFTVLRTVYRISVSADGSTRTQRQVLPMADIKSFTGSSTTAWIRSPIVRLARESSAYLYVLSFSRSGQYLYFLDDDSVGPFRLVVFEKDPHYDGKYQLRCQQFINRTVDENLPYDVELHLGAHAELPLAAVGILGTVYIWDWTNDSHLRIQSSTTVDVVSRVSFSDCGNFLVTRYDMGRDSPPESLEGILERPRLAALRAKHLTTERADARWDHDNDTAAHEDNPSSQLRILSTGLKSPIPSTCKGARGTRASISLSVDRGAIALTRGSGCPENPNSAAGGDLATTVDKLELIHLPPYLVKSPDRLNVQLLVPSGTTAVRSRSTTAMTLVIHEEPTVWTTLLPPDCLPGSLPMVMTLPVCNYLANGDGDRKTQWQLEDLFETG